MRMLLAVLAGLVLGVAARAATMQAAESASTSCGPITCTKHQECCVSPAPITYRCVAVGTCPYNR